MANSAKRNVTVTGSFPVERNALITEQGFLEIEEELNIKIIPYLRERINKALQRHALLRNIEDSGIKASDFIAVLQAHINQVESILEFFEKANKSGSTENRIRAQILQHSYKKMPGFNIAGHTSAPLKQYKNLLIDLYEDLRASKSLGGAPRDVCFNTLLRDMIEVHSLLKASMNRSRLNRLNFVEAIFSKMNVYQPVEGQTYLHRGSLEVTMQRLSRKIRDQN